MALRRFPRWRPRGGWRGCCRAGLVLWAGGAAAVGAQDAYTQSDFGGVGLLQTPTARMAQEGEFSFVLSRTTPYTNYNVSMQPLPWLEGSFRYTNVSNRLYGPRSLSGSQTYKDKSIDAKVRLWQESRWIPAVAVGARDVGGTGLFSSEYVVASKRAGPFDFSLGLAWGYIGARGDIRNPLGYLDDRFDVRPSGGTGTGKFSTNKFLRGRPGFFGGIEYRSPWEWLRLKAELDGNDYRHQPQNNNQPQRWPVNLGAVFRINRNVDLTLGYERGEIATAAINLHSNLARHVDPPKVYDPKPEAVAFTSTPVDAAQIGAAEPARRAPKDVDWGEMARALSSNAGIDVSRIGRRGQELVIHGEQRRFFYSAEGVGRATRIVDNRVDDSIGWLTVSSERDGLATLETSVHRPRFIELLDHRLDLQDFRRSVEQNPITPREEETLYLSPLKRFNGGVALGYQQNVGGPDAFVLYQVYAAASGTFNFSRNLWLDGVLAVNLANNYDKFRYDAPSALPRVRTNLRQYLTSSDVTLPNFQLTGTRKLGSDLYGLAYAGMLESMYAGAGGEVLYRPFGERWAIGADLNWVKQRGFRQDFALRRYHTITGQATGYLDTGFQHVTLAVSVGRYLAGDWGTTIDVSRQFSNGTRMGAYATITNKSGSRGYGEGSFDKGIYVSVPFDLLLPHSSRSRATLLWQPLIRDGGARLNKRYTLYTLTNDLDTNLFDKNLGKIAE
ncbi:YjbH domain-containing protein [Luteibacter sp. 329MFSha]|uniref:YjbH domain-containing protein n=1 Tax=Luteibacter sp. 329MFSha TaxID=1798239 RepID=UPI0008C44027|nr:YjbH domain-containing protein [Luteibacter sp. 329MFSha]SEV93288.1 Exopolysaccharide biosynthesis protein YbjH [Luteibacter sp. 329MFSha]